MILGEKNGPNKKNNEINYLFFHTDCPEGKRISTDRKRKVSDQRERREFAEGNRGPAPGAGRGPAAKPLVAEGGNARALHPISLRLRESAARSRLD